MSLTIDQAYEAKEILDSDSGRTANEVAKDYGYSTGQGLRVAIGHALQQEKKVARPEISAREPVHARVDADKKRP